MIHHRTKKAEKLLTKLSETRDSCKFKEVLAAFRGELQASHVSLADLGISEEHLFFLRPNG